MLSSAISRLKVERKACRAISHHFGNEYTLHPKYPEILDNSKKETARRRKLSKHKNIEALNTIEEKLFAINLDKYYGWNSVLLKEGAYPFNFLPFVKHVTHTSLKQVDKPTFHKAQGLNLGECEELLSRIRPHIQEALLFELNKKRKINDEVINDKSSDANIQRSFSNSIIRHVNSVLINYFAHHYPHLLECMIDYEPRQESFWLVGGFHPHDEEFTKRKENEDLSNKEREERVEHWFQYKGEPCLQVRSRQPLDVLNTEGVPLTDEPIPPVYEDPNLLYGLQFGRRHGTNIPGFWPGDKNEFGLMSFHSTAHLGNRPPHFGEADNENTLHSQAILASFSWLHSQASYQGFSTFSELTYPLVNQCILTDGKMFSFYLYQLNTTLFHSENIETNNRYNLCLALPPAPLYTDIKGTEFIGWNDDVLASLLSCYLNRPAEREGVNMKPYLDKSEATIADINDEVRRDWLHSQFKYMYANRPRHRLGYEIYDWERIYKVKFDTRGMEARTRPFERDENPTEDRKYYEHMKEYIPRAVRGTKKHWTGWRRKFAKTYYPEV